MELERFEFHLSQQVVFAPNAIEQVGPLTRDVGGRRVLLVTDPGIEDAGHHERALSSLRKASLSPLVFDGVEANPTTRHVEAGLKFAREHAPIDCILALGGGSAMDCAKGINFLLTNGGEMKDYWGVNKAECAMLPSVGVPTTAGTGSEAQSFALIAQESSHRKMACGDRKALFRAVILDPVLTQTMPPQLTAVTGIDAISHALESYVTTRRNPVSQMLAREAWRLLHASFEKVLNETDDFEARKNMLWGAHFAGAAIENSMLGAAHACANPLTARFGLTHGMAVGLMLPHVVRFNTDAAEQFYAELAEEVGLSRRGRASNRLSRRVTELLRLAQLPSRLRDCGVKREFLPELAREATEQWTGRFNPRAVTEDDFLELYEKAY